MVRPFCRAIRRRVSGARRLATVPAAAATESPLALTRRARRIDRELAALYPDAHIELDFTTPLELSVATILSAQCTDKRVNEVTQALFRRYRSAADYAGADRAELEGLIRTTGFFRNKTSSLIKLGQMLVERFDGEVPNRLQDLVTLPGFGRKTANVVLGNAFGVPGITVDTHLRPARAPLAVDERDRPGQGRVRDRRADPEEGLDDDVPPGDLARPPGVPRAQAGMRRLRRSPGSAHPSGRGPPTRAWRRSSSRRRSRSRRACERAGRSAPAGVAGSADRRRSRGAGRAAVPAAAAPGRRCPRIGGADRAARRRRRPGGTAYRARADHAHARRSGGLSRRRGRSRRCRCCSRRPA